MQALGELCTSLLMKLLVCGGAGMCVPMSHQVQTVLTLWVMSGNENTLHPQAW